MNLHLSKIQKCVCFFAENGFYTHLIKRKTKDCKEDQQIIKVKWLLECIVLNACAQNQVSEELNNPGDL